MAAPRPVSPEQRLVGSLRSRAIWDLSGVRRQRWLRALHCGAIGQLFPKVVLQETSTLSRAAVAMADFMAQNINS